MVPTDPSGLGPFGSVPFILTGLRLGPNVPVLAVVEGDPRSSEERPLTAGTKNAGLRQPSPRGAIPLSRAAPSPLDRAGPTMEA